MISSWQNLSLLDYKLRLKFFYLSSSYLGDWMLSNLPETVLLKVILMPLTAHQPSLGNKLKQHEIVLSTYSSSEIGRRLDVVTFLLIDLKKEIYSLQIFLYSNVVTFLLFISKCAWLLKYVKMFICSDGFSLKESLSILGIVYAIKYMNRCRSVKSSMSVVVLAKSMKRSH